MPDKIVTPKTNTTITMKGGSFIGSAVDLLKEIRIISGVNYRKYEEKSVKAEYFQNDICNQVINEFKYINKMIDKFKDKFELKGFKK